MEFILLLVRWSLYGAVNLLIGVLDMYLRWLVDGMDWEGAIELQFNQSHVFLFECLVLLFQSSDNAKGLL